MATLHIEHAIHDFDLWKTAFSRLADVRRQAGVVAHRVAQPVDDPHRIVIDLDFAGVEEAQRFLGFLQTQVWTSSDRSPALAGDIRTTILETADL